MGYFRAIILTPLLAAIASVVAARIVSKKSPLRRKSDSACILFLIMAVAVMNLLQLSYDERAFAGEFGLYLFGLLPFLAVLAISGAWGAIHLLRLPEATSVFKLMSVTTLAFIAAGMFGSLFGAFPSAWSQVVVGYFSASVLLALFWFGYRRRRDQA